VSGFVQVGGINGLIPKYMDAIPDSLRYPVNITTNDTLSNVTSHCGYPRADSFHIITRGRLLQSTKINLQS
jgi:hypothetical protein